MILTKLAERALTCCVGCLTFPNPVALIAIQVADIVGSLKLLIVRYNTALVTCVADCSFFFLCCAAVHGFSRCCMPWLDIMSVRVFRDPWDGWPIIFSFEFLRLHQLGEGSLGA